MCECVYTSISNVWWVRVLAMMPLWESEVDFQELVLSFHLYMSFGYQTGAVRLAGQSLLLAEPSCQTSIQKQTSKKKNKQPCDFIV